MQEELFQKLKVLGLILKTARERAELSQALLAKRARVPRVFVVELERGIRPVIDWKVVFILNHLHLKTGERKEVHEMIKEIQSPHKPVRQLQNRPDSEKFPRKLRGLPVIFWRQDQRSAQLRAYR